MDDFSREELHKKWVDSRLLNSPTVQLWMNSKVGVLGSDNVAGQLAQGVGSALLPGDITNFTNPVRSSAWSAFTPGGISRPRLRLPRPKEQQYRCPEGYQFGGRFTDSKWSTCGRQLFDLPSVFPSLLRIAEDAIRAESGVGFLTAQARVLRGMELTGDVIDRRAAQIPRVGPMSRSARENGTKEALQALVSNSSVPYMMVRRDGFPMMPVVPVSELRKVPDNRNMEDAVFLMQVSNIDMFGKDELGLLSNTGVTSLVYVMPNGSSIRMDRNRPLSVGERRKLGKTVSSASTMDNSRDPLVRLRSVVSESGGAISLSNRFDRINNPNEVIASGENRGLPRWSVAGFVPAKGRSEGRSVMPNSTVDADSRRASLTDNKKITNLQTAVEHLIRGGALSDIDPSILIEAIEKSNLYEERQLPKNRIFNRRRDNGVSFTLYKTPNDFEGIAAHFASTMQEHLGLSAPNIRLAGAGTNRPYLLQSAESVKPDAKFIANPNIPNLPPADLATLLISDYLTDVRRRNPVTIGSFELNNRSRAIAISNVPSGLIGLEQSEIKRRYALDLPDYLRNESQALTQSIRARNIAIRRQILSIYESLIARARAFQWDAYLSQLRIDGKLSQAEMRHMKIIKTLFEQRLDRLGTSQRQFREFLGITDE